jgi:TonB family protein
MENYQSYQRHLLDLTHMDYRIGLCNNFNVSSLKTRILMMNRKRTHVVAYLKYAFFVPLIVALFLFSNLNCTSNEKMNPLVHQAEKETPTQVVEESIESDSKMEMPAEEEKIAQPVEKTEETPKEVSITEVKKKETSQPVAESVVHEEDASATGEIIEEYSQIGEDLQDYKEDWESGMEETAAEEQASYQPGRPQLFSLLIKNLRYPPELIQEGIQGEVIIEAINRKDGELTDIKLIRGVHPLLDNEVLRVMNEMPKGAYYKHKRKRDPILTLPILFEIIGNRVKVTM